jgi:hypothetical protein
MSVRDRIAEIIYGDGNELLWPRALELADLIAWELSTTGDRHQLDGRPR